MNSVECALITRVDLKAFFTNSFFSESSSNPDKSPCEKTGFNPAVIKNAEVDIIKKYLAEKDASISIISKEGFIEETKIIVNHGVFMGNEGTVIRGGKKKVYVKLESLGQVMVVEFPAEYLSPI